jgi:hypothetical protein
MEPAPGRPATAPSVQLVRIGAPIALRDGSRVHIRQLRDSDGQLLSRGFAASLRSCATGASSRRRPSCPREPSATCATRRGATRPRWRSPWSTTGRDENDVLGYTDDDISHVTARFGFQVDPDIPGRAPARWRERPRLRHRLRRRDLLPVVGQDPGRRRHRNASLAKAAVRRDLAQLRQRRRVPPPA